jgi:hypothetical protein
MMPFLTVTEGELLQLDRTRRTALYHRSNHQEARPQPLSRRFAAVMRRAWTLAF